MTHIVTERCVDCRYTDCCTVCPVDCFYETESPAMLVIDPDTCIDCELCVPECPIQAIWPEDELPDGEPDKVNANRELYEGRRGAQARRHAGQGRDIHIERQRPKGEKAPGQKNHRTAIRTEHAGQRLGAMPFGGSPGDETRENALGGTLILERFRSDRNHSSFCRSRPRTGQSRMN